MMQLRSAAPVEPEARTREFYVDAMRILDEAGLPYLVGGGYAMAHYSGISRNTKDLDLFIKASDHERILQTLAGAGYKTEYFYPFWIAKVLSGESFIDLLYNSGNGLCPVDEEWFEHSTPSVILGHPVRLVPAEEQLWSKAFVQDRDRFDGADINHLILNLGDRMDWPRLMRRFQGHERVLLAHLVLFGYVYPSEKNKVPAWVMTQLICDVRNEGPSHMPLCRGTFLAHNGSYGTPIKEWDYIDARLQPYGPLTQEEIDQLPPL